jgi:hypothetical protein
MVILVVAAAANADVRIFLTKAGGTIPVGLDQFANAMIPTVSTVNANNGNSNPYDYSNPDFTPGLHTIDQLAFSDFGIHAGNGVFPAYNQQGATWFNEGTTYYIWLQFNRDGAGHYAPCSGNKLNGLKLQITGPRVTAVWYLQNDGIIAANKRWDGTATPPNYPELISHQGDVETLVGVNAAGLSNTASDASWNLYVGKNGGGAGPPTQGRMALLGAIQFTAEGIFNLTLDAYNFRNSATATWWLPTNIVSRPGRVSATA